ncbi:Heterodisulfide reductase subunit C-like protein [ANME-1 cluster archaeon GoMg1]|nr:Heterodisulfide reductase subunit C-like protein [ANME-1 cluster archaeon GoMg1]
MPIKTWELDPNFKNEIMSEAGGERLASCFQCSTCTLGCPIAEIVPGYNPRKIIQMSLLGMRDEVLSNPDLWICLICQTCTARCPQDVRIADVMGALRRIAEREEEAGKLKIDSPRPLFDKAFQHQLKKFGRLYDMGLAMEYYPKKEGSFIKGMLAMMKDYKDFGMRMFLKGKMGPLGGGSPVKGMLASKIKQKDVMKKIFEELGEEGKEK